MKSKNPCLLSIIVPVYNAEQYVKVCLDSLLHQNFDNYEIICVNDGSRDNSLSILLDYEKINSRIKVINKEIRYNKFRKNKKTWFADLW